jgi:acetylornithine deacetylase/succinyl-diaminopimelate desuccinylase-like protein
VGASDYGGCSVAVVEAARALLAGPPLRNDVILLLEDGEETTRAGSLSFVRQHPLAFVILSTGLMLEYHRPAEKSDPGGQSGSVYLYQS